MTKAARQANFLARIEGKGPIRGFQRALHRDVDAKDVRHVVGRLREQHLGPNARIGRVASRDTVRLDRQEPRRFTNLQVQVNDVGRSRTRGGTTVAEVIIPAEVFEAADRHPSRRHAINHLVNQARSALVRSFQSRGKGFRIVDATRYAR